MLLGTVEISRFAIIQQKLDKTASAMADFAIAAARSVNTTNLDMGKVVPSTKS